MQVVFHVVRCFSDQKVVHVEAVDEWPDNQKKPEKAMSLMSLLHQDPINIDPVQEPGAQHLPQKT